MLSLHELLSNQSSRAENVTMLESTQDFFQMLLRHYDAALEAATHCAYRLLPLSLRIYGARSQATAGNG